MFKREILGSILDEDRALIADTFEDYCSRNVESYRKVWEKDRNFPFSLMKDVYSIFGNSILTADPGERLDEVTLGAISETMGKFGFPVPAFLTLHFSKLLRHLGNEELLNSYSRKLQNGETVICGAFSEPSCGSDSAAIKTSARSENGFLVLNGEKSFVSSPGIANTFILSARTSEAEINRMHRGISLIVVDSDSEGLEPYEIESMASEFKGDFGGVVLNNVKVPEDRILGNKDEGFRLLMNTFNFQRVHVALYALGLAEKSLEQAVEYSKMRETFGNPISKYQAVSFRLAENWTRIEASRLLAYNALALPEDNPDSSSYCAGVKWYACENAFRAVDESLQTLGASGYVKTSEMEKQFRAARGFLIGDGTPDIQKLIIARNLLGRDFAP